MAGLEEQIRDWTEFLAPPTPEALYSALIGDNAEFLSSEGRTWDFKDRWPFSLSDEYFGGIVRLICAFANTSGGIIVFGVHDKKRNGGHNKTKINMDRFAQAVQQALGILPAMQMSSYNSDRYGNVDVLFVQKRSNDLSPYRFQKKIGKYNAHVIWVRQHFEVVSATPAHFPLLFCRAEPLEVESDRSVLGSLPPNPGALKRFIGRISVIDRLFTWLQNSDEPRNYLHGKGGSGKTSVAYEFASLIKDHGKDIRTRDRTPIENVIFLSAKEKWFSPTDGDIISIDVPDFSNEEQLYRQILYYGNWSTDRSYLEALSVDELRRIIIEFFDLTSSLIVIDDVDTLTTKGVDPGSDFLYRVLCRSKLSSKLLYTLRNAPSQSIINAIEVPGLEGNDYIDFVDQCVTEFNVPRPSRNFMDIELPAISESRPLVIESIIALVRTSGSYERAVTLFTQHAGENVRDYVFIREWDALTDPLARLLLAALSDLNVSTSFPDLQTVLQAEPSRIHDAIGATREMFLKIDDASTELLFSVAPLTKRFIDSRKKVVAGYGILFERIRNFRKNVQVSSPEVARISSQIDALVPARFSARTVDKTEEAYRIVSGTLPAAVTESPHFKCTLGYVACSLPQPNLPEARDAFTYALNMRVEPSFTHIKTWFNAERGSGIHDEWCSKVADIVISGRRYTINQKFDMMSWKASSLFVKGRDRLHTEQTDALDDLENALVLHLKCFRMYYTTGNAQMERAREYATNTAFVLFQFLEKSDTANQLWDALRRIFSIDDIYLDPLARPLLDVLEPRKIVVRRQDQLHRFRNQLRALADYVENRHRWLETKHHLEIEKAIEIADARCNQLLKERAAPIRG